MTFRNPLTSLPASAITGQITGAQIAAGAVGSTQVAAGAIGTTQIAPGSVTTPLLHADAITGMTITGGTINGATFNGTNWIEDNFGSRCYNGAPALGNLIASTSPAAGTDSFGNAFPAGIASLNPGATPSLPVGISNMINGILYSGFAPSATSQINYNQAAQFAAESTETALLQAPTTTGKYGVQFLFRDGATTGGPSATSPSLQIQSSSTVYASIIGALVGGDQVNGIATRQTPAYSTGWADSTVFNTQSGQMPLRYRKTNEDAVRIVGTAASTGTSSIVFVLPAGFRPLLGNCMIPAMLYDPTSAKVTCSMARVDGSGNVVFSTADGFPAVVSGTQVWIDGVVQLGNIP